MKKTFLFVLLLIVFQGFGQILEPVKWKYEKHDLDNNEFELVFSASVEAGWHLYSQNVKEGGPVRTSFVFYAMDDFEPVNSKVEMVDSFEEKDKKDFRVLFSEGEGHTEFDKQFAMDLKFFGEDTQFKQKFRWKGDKRSEIKGYFEFMCCDDTQCLPPAQTGFSFFKSAKEKQGSTGKEIKSAKEKHYKSTIKMVKKPFEGSELEKSLWTLFWLAFLGGLTAIITPCVFPMIPMTVSFFLKDKGIKAKVQAGFFGLSIIVIYTVIGTVIAVTLGANFANWLSTHWIPNVFFFLIFVFFAASFFGMFEITMPNWLISKSDEKADKGGYIGAFFMAFTLVLVSFSCTGPIVGMILVESASSQNWLEPIIGMLGFSLAFALPFSLFAFFPSLMGNMPKSGGWLNSVKVVLGFIELALGLKFLSIADQTYHWHILDREIYLAIWIVLFTLMGIYLLGKIKFAHDSDVKFISVPRLFFVIATFTFVIYLVPGMWGAPLKALSGYLPPMASHDFDLDGINRRNINAAIGKEESNSICETPKYHEFLHLPHGIEGYYDFEQALACAQKQNKPIFVDFTGHGCVNCREMEANVWSDPRVLKRLKEDYIVVSLYVDDKTFLPESDWVMNQDGELLKTLGKVNADLQIKNFNINAQPYYVLLSADGDLLAQPSWHDLDVDKYVKFLDEGKKNFKAGIGL